MSMLTIDRNPPKERLRSFGLLLAIFVPLFGALIWWRTGRMEGLGLVPGDHTTPGPGASNPIVRTLEERPDGVLWGDTNRWVFTNAPPPGLRFYRAVLSP